MRRLFIGFLALLPAIALAQRPDQLTRATSTTGANDSLIFAACDSVRPTCRMRGVTAGQVRKTMARGVYDSIATNGIRLVTGKRLTFSGTDTIFGTAFFNDTIGGVPIYPSRQRFLTGFAASGRDTLLAGSGLVYGATDTVYGQPVYNAAQLLPGTATNDAAAAGLIGEIITGSRASGSSLSLTSPTALTVDSISLTAGDWDVSGTVAYTAAGTTSITNLSGGISTTTNTLGALGTFFDWETAANVITATNDPVWATPTVRVSIAGTTTVFLIAQGTFSASTLKGYGAMRARRVR